MIEIIDGRQQGSFLPAKEYYRGRTLTARLIMPLTKRWRAYQVGRFLRTGETHLDIGCGDGYFMKRSRCRRVYGMDSKYGDTVTNRIEFASDYFDCVTMLAVIEHMANPEAVFPEVHRVLKEGGRFILTTPKKRSESVIGLYVPHIKDDHVRYYDLEAIQSLSAGLFRLVGYRAFMFGLNQVFCLEKS